MTCLFVFPLIFFLSLSSKKNMVKMLIKLEMMIYLIIFEFMFSDMENMKNMIWFYFILIIIISGVLSLTLLISSSKKMGLSLFKF